LVKNKPRTHITQTHARAHTHIHTHTHARTHARTHTERYSLMVESIVITLLIQ